MCPFPDTMFSFIEAQVAEIGQHSLMIVEMLGFIL